METKIHTINREAPQTELLEEAAKYLRNGLLVAFPTETVYGLGADALNAEAVEAIFKAKGRPGDNPLIVHIGSPEDLEKIAYTDDRVKRLAKVFWPGPLTMVLPKKPNVPEIVTAGLNTVAVRMPGHKIALALIKAAGLPVAAPSANLSGRPSPTTARHVLEDLNGRIPLILDGGRVEIGLESTVLDLSGKNAKILRPGAITKEDLSPYLKEVDYFSGKSLRPASPGMKYAHYAPRGRVILGDFQELLSLWQKYKDKKHLLIGWQESLKTLPQEANTYALGKKGDLASFAGNIYAAFRMADAEKIEIVIVEKVPEEGLGVAIMNRLKKAAASI